MPRRTRLAEQTAAPRRTSRVETFKPDRLAWRRAMQLARGDASRLVILSPTEILVLRAAPPKGRR